MKAPRYWSNPPDSPGAIARLLSPLAMLWRLGGKVLAASKSTEAAPVPVLCIGNLTAGGSGKSPMVAALLQRLAEAGRTPHVVTRGYGGTERGPYRVDSAKDSAAKVGDEPLMLAAFGPVWVARDRAAGARAAAAEGADLILLDDGFQNPGLRKDGAILMIDAGVGFGNGRIIPAGPLREPVGEGLSRADLVVLVGQPDARENCLSSWPQLAKIKVVGAELVPRQSGMVLEGDPVFAFAGIGRPEKFFYTLRHMCAQLVGTRTFPDHHPYSPAIIRRLIRDAMASNAMLVTTEKDAVRLPQMFRRDVMTVQVVLEPEDWSSIDALVQTICGAPRPG
ncbi:MAG: tetraacyldisaccharide 4'-kinase [Pseudomonadota bacterium]